MNLDYRILNCDMFESYMALEGWENFPMLKSYTDNGEFSFLMEESKFMVFDFKPSDGLLKAVGIYKMFGDVLCIDLFEVNKNYRHIGVGLAAIERLLLETGAKKISLDAKNKYAAKFWDSLGFKKLDEQTFVL